MRTSALSLSLLLLVACGDGTGSDAGPRLDAATSADAGGGGTDAGDVDAGSTDAGDVDAGDVDAGSTSDAGADCAGAMVDGACTTEGAFCGGPCTDACSFCNLLSCSGGTWNRVEVFPAPCFDCGGMRCETGRQHCVHAFSDVGGEPDTFMCADNPTDCRNDMATCACIEMTLTFDRCVEPNPGEVEGQYLGG